MRRWLLAAAAAIALALAPATAEANPLSALLKAAKLASKAADPAATAARAAKAGAAAKGVHALGLGVAAERVFVHVPAVGERVAVFVGRTDDGLQAIVRGSDDVVGQSDVGRVLGEFDEMAAVAPEAGVDLIVDVSALDDLAHLPVGPNTRLFVSLDDGAPLALETVLRAGEPVAVVRPREGLAVRVSRHVDVAVDVAELAFRSTELSVDVPPDAPCADELRAGAASLGVEVDRNGVGPVIDLTGPAPIELSGDPAGGGRVALGLADACARDEAGGLRALAVLQGLAAAQTWGDAWALAGAGDLAVVDGLEEVAGGWVVRVLGADGRAWTFTVRDGEDPRRVAGTSALEAGFGAAVVALVVVVGLTLRGVQRRS